MDYIYENLGDERFQEFCASLIAARYPDIQAFPVGQPDGGRDMIVYEFGNESEREDGSKKEFIVFQVKFVRNANHDRDAHLWLIDTIDKEVDKIDKLISKGATKYYLITNVKGTAHLDNGSIDKVSEILSKRISIPSFCWWRDDLNSMLETLPMFKWSFPEILNGKDLFNSVLFQSILENRERRESVIRAYLMDQYEIDNEVKFKQIDLQNRLLNLFTDVPVSVKKINERDKGLKRVLGSIMPVFLSSIEYAGDVIHERSKNIGAAEFLLHPKVQNGISRVLLEGGPGQGKSTISQYICQVHRARLLNKDSDIELLPEKIRSTPVRLPFKIDLRDIALWVEKKNPYNGILSQEYFDRIWKNSLESFLTAHIFYHSKLEEFTSIDFIAVCKLSHVLIVFDGFDEIANVKVRSEVIDFINRGLTRLSVNSQSMQVIVTSRPAAFSDSVGFSIENYPHFELTDITIDIINEYLEKWIKASKLDSRDAGELRKLVKDKIELPHLKELAKSPMQLAIFISLLRTKGQSLPNKRTALYDSYINLFFDRESEKSSKIREKRDLIIDIHKYLAWVLHSDAELLKNNGIIDIKSLIAKLADYLNTEGHNGDFASDLFDVMKERVCALVSRVQGTFEFEVQPLREYFCAKYLYESAPHSSAGAIKPGTKPDRFHAILRNFYWQNVVRFFAGCADAGELDMIIQELRELQNDEVLRYTDYPRIITAQILSDYVFSQKPLKLKAVVKILVDGINIGNIVNQSRQFSSTQPLTLPNECGRQEIINECFNQLKTFPKTDYATELIGVIINNPHNNVGIWEEFAITLKGERLTRWIEFGYNLELIHKAKPEILLRLLDESDSSQIGRRMQFIISGNRTDIFENRIDLKELVLLNILQGENFCFEKETRGLFFITLAFHTYVLTRIFEGRDSKNNSYMDYLNKILSPNYENKVTEASMFEFLAKDTVDEQIKKFIELSDKTLNLPLIKFMTEVAPWNDLIEKARKNFGEKWQFYSAATIAANIKSKEKIDEIYSDFDNEELSLCYRVRYARFKSGNMKFWEGLLSNSKDKKFVLLVLFTWATPKVITGLVDNIILALNEIGKPDFRILVNTIKGIVRINYFTKSQQSEVIDVLKARKDADILKFVLSFRFTGKKGGEFIYQNIKKYTGLLEDYQDYKLNYAIDLFVSTPSNLSLLKQISSIYKNMIKYGGGHELRSRVNSSITIPYNVAKLIMNECKEYPRLIGTLAERSCRSYANNNQKLVGDIAKRDQWF